MIRALAAILLAAACGGDDTMAMRPPPSGPVFTSKAAQRIERGRQDAARFGAYAPSVFVRPATMDAAAAEFLAIPVASFVPPALMRLKGVDRVETFTGAEIMAAVGVAPQTVTACVVLCEYTEDGSGITISEIARGISSQVFSTASQTAMTVDFPVPVTLDPNKKYAVGASYFTSGGGATLVGSSNAGVTAIRFPLFSFGTTNTRIDVRWDGVNNAQVEWVERGAGNIYDRPLVTMVGPSPTARWY